jgi:hypothetical protein
MNILQKRSVQVTFHHLILLENMNFLEYVEKFKSMKNQRNRYYAATKIMFLFVRKNSEMELNLPSNVFKSLNQKFTECSENEVPMDLFEVVETLIFQEIRSENFKTFLKTENWLNFIKKHQYFLKDILEDEDQDQLFHKARKQTEIVEKIPSNQFPSTTSPSINRGGI